ncbi:nitrate reductase molybdenum cofactor assembly chaperone [Saccharibacillus sp. CPCC 101409]|uniref:nitrate reductase molybdenum cofactor assembly chaperone n=1 Tax=Saccharibacillus sp. CPCC 101409 TaxID=3058041 RepID=UPI0026715905|nr:nitrate reductase molybdenum cofactor assembly chaperone [Saccharibacillus sp. CPCC 101409]MDO3412347.1 nitrate reductase molybdenum cofactor assembly chaperone [Saccharibacillus sp. CPCC 101409]
MIDIAKLYDYKNSFGFFANQLLYPDKLNFHPLFLEESFTEDHPALSDVRAYWADMHERSLDEIREMYTETFDFQKDCALYMTYFKFEDAKERGQMLLRLKILYEMFGLEMPEGELPDYLPLMCEFLYAAEWMKERKAPENFRLLFGVFEDGTYHLLAALEKMNSPYRYLVQGLRRTLRACIEQETVNP